MNLFIPGDSKYLTLCEVEVYGEGEIKQADLVFWETKTIVKIFVMVLLVCPGWPPDVSVC